ncbi:hypothetical protein [Nesterenkonia lutea]|uniref:Uncharacterized protein n=1 Tax=Nesterenkonia lutea TaxID=272919 RepID=A0ABR9JBH6_9MICC|nr:hypothetical protein [Nesterenkonia lutea]MBE1523140.1 hypothetical protein [Nesterenkonia lutea]
MTHDLAPAARRIVGLDALVCLAAVGLGVAGGLVLTALGETLIAGSISGESLSFYPVLFIMIMFPAFVSAGVAVVAIQVLRRVSGTKKTARWEALLGAAVVALGISLGIYSWGGMGSILAMALTGLPAAFLTWLGLRRTGAIAARRAVPGLS